MPLMQLLESATCRWRIPNRVAKTPERTRDCGDFSPAHIRIVARLQSGTRTRLAFQSVDISQVRPWFEPASHTVMLRSVSDTAHDSGSASGAYGTVLMAFTSRIRRFACHWWNRYSGS